MPTFYDFLQLCELLLDQVVLSLRRHKFSSCRRENVWLNGGCCQCFSAAYRLWVSSASGPHHCQGRLSQRGCHALHHHLLRLLLLLLQSILEARLGRSLLDLEETQLIILLLLALMSHLGPGLGAEIRRSRSLGDEHTQVFWTIQKTADSSLGWLVRWHCVLLLLSFETHHSVPT